jgi:stearoyl-CoA desaturase (delta-9 desaturase)
MSLEPTADASDLVRPSHITERVSWVVFWLIHVGCVAAIWTGISARAAIIGVALYLLRMFVITGGYHRYFSHRGYKTSRAFQFILGLIGTMTVQKGPLWWASTHRKHHRFSDTELDVHSPKQRGFWYSHVGWVTSGDHIETDLRWVKDLAKYPELRWLGKYHFVAPVALAVLCYLAAGWSGLVVGFGWSTVLGWHITFTINSLSHVFGKRRFETGDTSRNNWILAILTMGEGWHNNHHYYQSTANQGFYWWEIDLTYYVLRALAAVGVVWDLRAPPEHVLELGREGMRRGVVVGAPPAPEAAPVVAEAAPVALPDAA